MKPEPLKVKLSSQRKPFTDVVGLELGAGLAEGVPAVRLRKREGVTTLIAAGFLRLPGVLPEAAASAEAPVSWLLPRAFQAPYAALAVNSKFAFLRHAAGAGDELPEKKQFAYRQATRAIGPDLPPLTAGLPEFQAAWAARLFPEGRCPTACSLQVAAAAAMAGFCASPNIGKSGGNAIALFVFPEHTALAAFQDGKTVLYREHPVGSFHLRNAVSAQMRIEVGLADAVLEDTLIDPAPIIEPVLRPLFRQVEISADYLLRRRNCPVKNYFVCGLTAGARYWSIIFSHMMNQPLTPHLPFEGLQQTSKTLTTGLSGELEAATPLFMAAAGAARAVLEDV